MNSNRRNFLRNITLGTGALVGGLPAWARENPNETIGLPTAEQLKQTGNFNMSGYAAPKLETVRIGIVGLGMRGPGAVERMSFIEIILIANNKEKCLQQNRPPAGCLCIQSF